MMLIVSAFQNKIVVLAYRCAISHEANRGLACSAMLANRVLAS